MEQRLRFETLLLDISARLMAMHPDQVDSEIETALGRILEFFDVDRCGLLEFHRDEPLVRITHAVFGEGIEPVGKHANLAELYPWSYEQLINGNRVNILGVEDYPEDALKDRQSHQAMGVKTTLNIPLAASDGLLRVIVINHIRRHQSWPEEYIARLRLLGDILVNALGRRKDRLRLEMQLKLEMLLSDISARFVNLPADRIDVGIEDAQRRICELLDLDRATLWQIPEQEPGGFVLTHIYQPPGIPLPPERMNAKEILPWTTQKILSGETVIISKLTDLPAEAGRDFEAYGAYTKSTVSVPLSVGGGPIFGAVAFAVARQERDWPETVVTGFKLVAQMFANALARKHADQALSESQALLSSLIDSTPDLIWSVDPEHFGLISFNRSLAEYFLHNTGIHITAGMRPEDLLPADFARQWHEIYRKALEEGSLTTEYSTAAGNRALRLNVNSLKLGDKLFGLSVFAQDMTERKKLEEQLKEKLKEIEALKQRLESENVYLQEEIKLLVEHADIVGQCPAMKKILSQAEQVARTDSTVLLLGETGTGKELLARAIHGMSMRKGRPLVTVNCAALPPTLIESELFGREKGAYTGALTRMAGRFELADGSTLFLDEIGELPLEIQSKLLRILEEGTFERVGSSKPLHVNVRIIAATNRDIAHEVETGKFRRDLFYRLNVFPIVVPPLRERTEDIPLLVRAIVQEFQKRMGKEVESIPQKTMQALQAYSWPGNVRELRNLIEHAMIVSRGKTLNVQVPKPTLSELDAAGNLDDIERAHMLAVLNKTGWRISGPGGAAEILGLKRTTLQSKMEKMGIRRNG